MGPIIVAAILGGIGTLLLGLISAWLRAELAAWFEPTIRWMISKGVARFPEETQAGVHAEILDMNAAQTSPTLRLLDACWFYASVGRSVRALQEVSSPPLRSNREFRRSIYRAVPWSLVVLAAGALQNVPDAYAILTSSHQYPGFAVVMAIGLLGQFVGGFMTWRHFRALRRVRKFLRA